MHLRIVTDVQMVQVFLIGIAVGAVFTAVGLWLRQRARDKGWRRSFLNHPSVKPVVPEDRVSYHIHVLLNKDGEFTHRHLYRSDHSHPGNDPALSNVVEEFDVGFTPHGRA